MRVFAGLPLPAPVIDRLLRLAAELKNRYQELRVVRPQALHVTLVFFGELDQDQVLEVMRIMDSPRLKVASIRAVIGGIGQFPPRGRPRVLFCPLVKGGPEISYLYRCFMELLVRNGNFDLQEDREFTPHITLARNKGLRIELADLEALFGFEDSLILDRLVLYQSILKPQGAEYRSLKTVMFE